MYRELRNGVFPGMLEWMDRRSFNDLDLQFALTSTGACFATDPRDKVFALLGLLSKVARVQFEPDYNLTPTEVFTLTAAQLATGHNSLKLLSHVDAPPPNDGRPSWAPS